MSKVGARFSDLRSKGHLRDVRTVFFAGDGPNNRKTPCPGGSLFAFSLPLRCAGLVGRGGADQGGGGQGGVAGQAGRAVVGPGGQELVGAHA
eukprot:scaffold4410_cov53-Phaeocystis_antarctica.AAC.5